MTRIAEILRQKKEQRLISSWMSSETTYVTLAGLSLIPQSVLWAQDASEFGGWKSDFEKGFAELRDSVKGRRESLDQQYAAFLEHYGYRSLAEASSDPELGMLINSARNAGVKARWDFEQFFAQRGGDGARRTLTYVGDRGNDVLYDDAQFESLLSGGKAEYEGRTLEGHHINSVKSGLEGDLTNIDHLHDPENVRLMTHHSHRNDSDRGHGGSYHNETADDANDVTQKYDGVVEGNRDAMVNETADARELPIALGAALAAGSIAAILEVRRLRNDPRPWNKKASIVACTFALRGVEGGLISTVALLSRDAVAASPVAAFAAESVAGLAAETSLDLTADSLQNLLGGAVGLEAVVVIRLGIGAASDLAQGMSLAGAWNKHGQTAIVATGENIAFLLLGIAVDSAIPDPTGILIGVRIVYSLGKTAYKANENKKSREDCLNCRLQITYEQAKNHFGQVRLLQ